MMKTNSKMTKLELETASEWLSKVQGINECFDRTMNNCRFYEREGRNTDLLNEVGVLRGLAYALEEVGICPHSDEFLHYIDVQNELKKGILMNHLSNIVSTDQAEENCKRFFKTLIYLAHFVFDLARTTAMDEKTATVIALKLVLNKTTDDCGITVED